MDERKPRQVRPDIQCEPMISDPAPDGDTEGGDLAIPDPDAGSPLRAFAENVVSIQRTNERLLERAQPQVQVAPDAVKGDDRVTHELTRAVVRDFPAAIGLNDGDIVRCQHVTKIGSKPQREYGRMLDDP